MHTARKLVVAGLKLYYMQLLNRLLSRCLIEAVAIGMQLQLNTYYSMSTSHRTLEMRRNKHSKIYKSKKK